MNTQGKLSKAETVGFPTRYGLFRLTTYQTNYTDQPSMKFALAIQTDNLPEIPIVRIHSSCIFSEVLGSRRCDCGEQLEIGLKIIAKQGGVLLYLDQEGRGHGLFNKTREYKLQEESKLDTVEASERLRLEIDSRTYDVAVDILNLMNISRIRLLTNNPRKLKAMEQQGINVAERIPIRVSPNEYNRMYLAVKKKKLGHMLNPEDDIMREESSR